MTKKEFLSSLESKLQGLPKEDINNRLDFYSEMIDDRIEEGKTEDQAIEEIGSVDEVVEQIAEETPLLKLVKERIKPKRSLRAWEIIVIILGFPLWLPLLLVFAIICFIPYILMWVFVLVTYAMEIAFAASSIYGIAGFFLQMSQGNFSLMYIGIALLGLGLSFLFIFACIGITKGTIKLTKVTGRNIKSSFVKKGA